MADLPFSQAAENNREVILERLRGFLAGRKTVLEIGAGTGQHAVHFADGLPHLTWQATEHPDAMDTLRPRLQAAGLANLAAPVALDIAARPWNVGPVEAIYTANTLHIVGEDLVEAFFAGCAEVAPVGSLLLTYGPFRYGGQFTTESNARFDEWLKARDPRSGIRDFERVDALARAGGYALREDCAMPANNQLLCWEREG